MKKYSIILIVFLIVTQLQAQVEPGPAIGKHGLSLQAETIALPAPSSYKNEIAEVLDKTKKLRCKNKTTDHLLECWCTRISTGRK
jgi:hypothetical protein